MFKKISLSLLLFLSLSCFSQEHQPGFYFDAKLGDGHFREIHHIDISHSGLVGQATAGYEFTDFFALEFGYLQLPKMTITAPSTSLSVKPKGAILSGKFMLPLTLSNSSRFYFKYSAAHLHDTPDIHHKNESPRYVSHGKTKLIGLGSVGVDYQIYHNIYVNGELSYSSIKDLPDMTLGMAGLSYKF